MNGTSSFEKNSRRATKVTVLSGVLKMPESSASYSFCISEEVKKCRSHENHWLTPTDASIWFRLPVMQYTSGRFIMVRVQFRYIFKLDFIYGMSLSQ